jgi:hypothetical protein
VHLQRLGNFSWRRGAPQQLLIHSRDELPAIFEGWVAHKFR